VTCSTVLQLRCAQEFFSGVSTNTVEDRGRKVRGSDGGVTLVRGSTQLLVSEVRILIRFLWIYFPHNWEFDSVLTNLQYLGGGVENPPSVRHYFTFGVLLGFGYIR
jgi:hypothetical protein